jgi:phage/plasmid-like protein (TIGR03299 family)
MAHNLEQFEDGTTAFFTAREVAWHKLGTVTDGALDAETALQKAHLDWTVFKSDNPVTTMVPMFGNSAMEEGSMEEVTHEDRFITYRYHPKTKQADALGVVGNRYTPVQNADAFSFLNYVSDESGAVFETAGSIDNGRKVFMTMKLPEGLNIGGVDAIDMYLMAWNTHDGSSSFSVAVTPIRVVCQNTLTAALRQAKSKFSVRHTASSQGKIQAAREALGITFKYAEEFEREAESLLSQAMTDKEFAKMVEVAIPLNDPESPRAVTMAEQARGTLMALWNAPTQANVKNTKWAAYNTFAEYSDWAKPVRSKDGEVARAERIVNGSGDRFKNKMLALLN